MGNTLNNSKLAPGNHDFVMDFKHNPAQNRFSDKHDQMSASEYRNHFGPDYYSFNQGSWKFIVLNSELMWRELELMNESWNEEFKLSYEKQMEWLKNELKNKQKSIIFMHRPPLPNYGIKDDTIRNDFLDLCSN